MHTQSAFCRASQRRKPFATADRRPLRFRVMTRNMLKSVEKLTPTSARSHERLPPRLHRVRDRERGAAFRQLCDEIWPDDALLPRCRPVQHRRAPRPACGILRRRDPGLGPRVRHGVRPGLQGHRARRGDRGRALAARAGRALRVQPQGSEGPRRGRLGGRGAARRPRADHRRRDDGRDRRARVGRRHPRRRRNPGGGRGVPRPHGTRLGRALRRPGSPRTLRNTGHRDCHAR